MFTSRKDREKGSRVKTKAGKKKGKPQMRITFGKPENATKKRRNVKTFRRVISGAGNGI